jgi:hypothetical protein
MLIGTGLEYGLKPVRCCYLALEKHMSKSMSQPILSRQLSTKNFGSLLLLLLAGSLQRLISIGVLLPVQEHGDMEKAAHQSDEAMPGGAEDWSYIKKSRSLASAT